MSYNFQIYGVKSLSFGKIPTYHQYLWVISANINNYFGLFATHFFLQNLEQGKEVSEESSEEEEEVQCVDLEPVANIDELFDDFRGHLFLMLVFFVGI